MSTATEKHFPVQEAAKLWCVSDATARRLIDAHPEIPVLRIVRPADLRKRHKLPNGKVKYGKRVHTTIRIPQSSLVRLYETLK